MRSLLGRLSTESSGQGIAEYAVMLGVIITLMVATVQLVSGHGKEIFSRVASAIR